MPEPYPEQIARLVQIARDALARLKRAESEADGRIVSTPVHAGAELPKSP